MPEGQGPAPGQSTPLRRKCWLVCLLVALLIALAVGLLAARSRGHSHFTALLALPEQQLRRMALEQPQSAEVRVALGTLLRRAGHLDQARRLLAEGTKLDPGSAEAWHALGLCQQRQREYAAAVQSLEKAVELAPHDPDCQRDLGWAYELCGQPPEAVRCYERALELDPHDPVAAYQLTTQYLEGRDFPGREERLERAVQLTLRNSGRTSHALSLLGRVKEAMGDWPAAEAAYWEALSKDPENAIAIYRLGGVLMHQGEVEKGRKLVEAGQAAMRANAAVATLNEQVRQQPDNPRLHLELARALRRVGQEQTAQWYYRECLRLDPDNAAAQRELRMVAPIGPAMPSPPAQTATQPPSSGMAPAAP